MQKVDVKEGHEIRGFVVRIYPTKEQENELLLLEGRLRRVWNWLVKQVEDVLEARAAWALKGGLVPPRPVRPSYDGLTPEESKAAACEHGARVREWAGLVHAATKDAPECQFRNLEELIEHYGHNHDYQLLKDVVRWQTAEGEEKVKISAALLQSLAKNYKTHVPGARRKKFRRASDSMPIQVRSGTCFMLGDFGTRGAGHRKNGEQPVNYYNCQITIAGLKIRGRLPGRAPWGRIIEGVSLSKKVDGWYASIKQEIPKRVLPAPVPGSSIGIDVGLDNIAAFSDGRVVRNHRAAAYTQRIAGLQAERTEKANKKAARLQQAAARHTKHVLYNQVVKPLADVETIVVEALPKHIGQMGGSSKVSSMRKVVEMLTERYGDRVREVSPSYTSQDCSQCGYRSKESWSYEHGRMGECPKCGHREDRDVNAARNIEHKYTKSEAAE